MSEEKAFIEQLDRMYKPIIENGGYFVLVSHQELNDLVGTLMQMLELNGDAEQRSALKHETKRRCREWLDYLYQESGYDKWSDGLQKGVKPISISAKVTAS